MHKFRMSSYLVRFLLLTLMMIVIAVSGMFALANNISGSAFSAANTAELTNAISQVEDIYRAYLLGELNHSELYAAVNPVLNAGDVFYMLISNAGEVEAYTESAVPYFGREKIRKYIELLDEGEIIFTPDQDAAGMTLMLGSKIDGGYVFAGKPMRNFYGATSRFRVGMLTWILPLTLILLALCVLASRLIARPAMLLTNAAMRMAKGDVVMLDDDLPGEIGEVALAFNHMSEIIASTINALNNEKEAMRRILEGLSEGILAIDFEGAIIHENSAAVRLLGESDSPAYLEVLDALKKSLHISEDTVNKLARGDAILAYSITHLPTEERRGGTIALIRDVTEQERLERTRHDYVANISHELRTPLANMRGLAEGLRDGLVTDERDKERYYGMIVDEIKRLSRLVNDLLELSGLQSNHAAFEIEKVEPTELIWELFDLNKHLFAEKKQQFSLQAPEADLPAIMTNEDRLSEVLTIFMDNARKYTKEGGSVTLGAELKENGVRFFVNDTGIGMDEETQRLAFDRFHQAERSHADKGSGLGLSIAREILQKMGVEIMLKSAPGIGSEFSFILPFH